MPLRPLPSPARTRAAAVAGAVAVLLLAACSGEDEGGQEQASPAEVMEAAKQVFDETEGVRIELTSDGLPDGVTGLLSAEGVGTHAPAFEGTIKVSYSGLEPQVPVVAVDGTVHAQLPFTTGWNDIDPAEYGAPDPAALMGTENGFSALLPATTGVERGDQVRGGKDNREVLTEYVGTAPASVVANIIPSAEGDFEAAYTINEDDELRELSLTGVFYPGSEAMTYTVAFSDYGTSQEITAP